MIKKHQKGINIIHKLILLLRDHEFRKKINLDDFIDDLEYLPALILKPEDCSQEFHDYFQEMCLNYNLPRLYQRLSSAT